MSVTLERRAPGIPIDEIEVLRDIVVLRLADPQEEARRIARVSSLLWAADQLRRALSIHTMHALVGCRGTPGTGDLAADARALRNALERYLDLVRVAAIEFGDVAKDTAKVAGASQ